MSEGLTPDEIEDFYADTIAPMEPVEINTAKIKINVVSETDFAEAVAVKIKNEVDSTEATSIKVENATGLDEVAPVDVKDEATDVVNTTDIDALAATIRETSADNFDLVSIDVERSDAHEIDDAETEQKHGVFKRAHQVSHRIWWRRVGTVATVIVAIVALALVGLRIAGFRTFTVMSGSMEPDYPVGAMIYVKPVDYKSLKVGDVISFVANNDKTVVTHRIDEIAVDENDSEVWRFRTKGDANTTADAQLVHYKNVIGTPVTVIPYIGYLAHNIQQPPGIYIALVVGSLLLAWTFLPGTLEGRRKTARNTTL